MFQGKRELEISSKGEREKSYDANKPRYNAWNNLQLSYRILLLIEDQESMDTCQLNVKYVRDFHL